jgi:membrane protein required for colicin V production
MSAMTFSFVDVVVILILLVSTGYAVYRGFVSETLSIFAWAAAAFATLYFGPWVAPLLRGLISPNWLAYLLGYALVFVAVLIPLSFASHRFAQGVRGSPINALDQAMGGVFGVVRALALIGILYLVYSAIVPVRAQPRWMTEAWFLPVIQSSSEVLLSLVPEQNGRAVAHSGREKTITDLINDTPEPQVVPKPNPRARARENRQNSYGADDRQALDRLIQATDKGNRQP